MRTPRLAASALTALLALAALSLPASAELSERKLRKIEESARVLEAFLRARDAEIPRELLADARTSPRGPSESAAGTARA